MAIIEVTDQTFEELRGAQRRRFVVVVLHLELIGFTADLDAAHLVDALDAEIVAALRDDAVGGVFAGQRDGRADDERVVIGR